MAGGGVGEAMLISAITGAGTSAVTGGDPIKGALLGAATGGIGHGVAGATTAADAANVAGNVGTTAAEQMVAQTTADEAARAAIAAQPTTSYAGANLAAAPTVNPAITGGADAVTQQGIQALNNYPLAQVSDTSNLMFPKIAEAAKSGYFYPGLGMGASVIGESMTRPGVPGAEDYSGPLSRFSYDPDKYRRAASGGLMDTEPARRMAGGGHLGSYSDGGQTLKGPGDGMSDDIPATIGDTQPARLADGEFVVPADVVSGLGNGSTDAGADALYAMLDRVRKARTGRTEQAPEIDPNEYMPA